MTDNECQYIVVVTGTAGLSALSRRGEILTLPEATEIADAWNTDRDEGEAHVVEVFRYENEPGPRTR